MTISWRQTLLTLVTTYRTPGISPIDPAQSSTNTLDLDLVVLIDKVDGTVANRKSGNLPAVLDGLDAHTFPDSPNWAVLPRHRLSPARYPSLAERLPADPT